MCERCNQRGPTEVTAAMAKAGGRVLVSFDSNTPYRTADEEFWATETYLAMEAARLGEKSG